jgi:ribosomal protein L14E/L6E/L27E
VSAEKITVGQIIVSAAGRDKGHAYVVIEKLSPSRVWVADGRERKISSPKKKNVRHVNIAGSIAESIAEKLRAGNPVTDEDIRHALKQVSTSDISRSGEEERLRVQR